MANLDRYLYPQMSAQRIIPMILWPISLFMVVHRSVFLGVNGDRTDDFKPVYAAAYNFLNNLPVYGENYATVDPHYLYPPSGTLLMAPVAIIDYERARWAFIAVSVVALLISAYLLTRMFGYALNSWVMPTVLFVFFFTETVSHTLIFTNFNSFVLLGMIAFLMLMRSRHDWWAGVPMGLTIAVKPILAPLMLLPLLNRQWRVFVFAVVVPLVLTAVAWPLSVDADAFISRTVPYLGEARDYYNSSIAGNGAYFGVSPWLVLLLRAAFVVMAAFSLWFLYRYYRKTNELLWLATSSGVLLGTAFLVGSLGQGYYSMLLFPLLMTVLLPGSAMRNWPAWLGVYGCMTFDSFYSQRWTAFGWMVEYNKVTWGWSLLMIAVFCSLLFRWLDMRSDGVAGEDVVMRSETDAPPAPTAKSDDSLSLSK
ncbi:glycosyltransferase family 87 protein [Gordonia alkanivorans]|uniref:Membrane protein n=1 Tax=Gordonia alkanivorans CGMCC 6845 TaxID=1423140 RepID=W9DD51_9ACTN|nr:glycosyltransferase family 87 protein [Gordonia alkanivorans]ETA06304.1 membrane protein [Gordonia alkanivorans CGMCC 6845]MDH3006499.1 glycosyltransferase family 87 protein [Gordonia alkanivorans]MDH3014256.1 glycosyltransferase family 87 protein [Gordonia alkanivorans]MDH3041343.1 glycosyltransferase family 87 protein [Gordonia alkanivorans]MDH3048411.1 glycosyltransferase family 87 protein [Gordonia alkanivorans]